MMHSVMRQMRIFSVLHQPLFGFEMGDEGTAHLPTQLQGRELPVFQMLARDLQSLDDLAVLIVDRLDADDAGAREYEWRLLHAPRVTFSTNSVESPICAVCVLLARSTHSVDRGLTPGPDP